jgi:choline kinase
VRAIILAAGVGRRLSPFTLSKPKCLLPVGGRSLLERMLESLDGAGSDEVLLVVGHCQEQIRERIGSRFGRLPVRYVQNPDYLKGSVRSLWSCREDLRGDLLVMDADVLFPSEFLRRLIAAPSPSAFLLDQDFADTGEEMKLFVRGDRVVAIRKTVLPEAYDRVGEGVGFFKCAAVHAEPLRECLEETVTREPEETEYEVALDRLLRRVKVGYVDISGLPWTEIDFPEDLRRAEEEVLPSIGHVPA